MRWRIIGMVKAVYQVMMQKKAHKHGKVDLETRGERSKYLDVLCERFCVRYRYRAEYRHRENCGRYEILAVHQRENSAPGGWHEKGVDACVNLL